MASTTVVPRINLIVAACSNNGIGINGQLPWRLKRDMAFFKDITMTTNDPEKQNIVIMGRKTFFSIPEKFRPLKNRVNVVLSREIPVADANRFHIARSFLDAMELLTSEELSSKIESVFVIGGASVYKTALESAKNCRIYFTDVDADVECDTFFPSIDPDIFRKLDHSEYPDIVPKDTITEKDLSYTFQIFDKIADVLH